MPTFSAKVYEMMKYERSPKDEKILGWLFDKSEEKNYMKILGIFPKGHVMGESLPIFKEIKKEEIDKKIFRKGPS